MSALPFTSPFLLAPMEGVTEPCFRGLVLDHNAPEHLGGAFTEFVRVIDHPVSRKTLLQHLGDEEERTRFAQPVGIQLMGASLDDLAATVERAVEIGVPLIDLNFGCPAKGALRGCAGAALLCDWPQLERVVATCVRAAAGAVPITAKVRAGYDHADDLEDIARAAESGGASLLTVHCRTRREGYQPEVDWGRIRRAVAAVSMPVCGNGGIRRHEDLERMRRETGCALAMVGQGALADPWIFSGHEATSAEAVEFLETYVVRLRQDPRSSPRGALARLKQLLGTWRAGGLPRSEEERTRWLRTQELDTLLTELRTLAGTTSATR